ncbi:hypothetical protein EYF80_047477 [Liparis tanakae]|uniref:Uncharacterized protein n=1 Tax=Liparis tanakae TaxID=230148 RepID=A0A4Z2FND4_9TELE|nr:hypothetical protein EYF80_047477 [Liparis tanakae]
MAFIKRSWKWDLNPRHGSYPETSLRGGEALGGVHFPKSHHPVPLNCVVKMRRHKHVSTDGQQKSATDRKSEYRQETRIKRTVKKNLEVWVRNRPAGGEEERKGTVETDARPILESEILDT